MNVWYKSGGDCRREGEREYERHPYRFARENPYEQDRSFEGRRHARDFDDGYRDAERRDAERRSEEQRRLERQAADRRFQRELEEARWEEERRQEREAEEMPDTPEEGGEEENHG